MLSKSNCDFLGYGVAFLDHVVLFFIKIGRLQKIKETFQDLGDTFSQSRRFFMILVVVFQDPDRTLIFSSTPLQKIKVTP